MTRRFLALALLFAAACSDRGVSDQPAGSPAADTSSAPASSPASNPPPATDNGQAPLLSSRGVMTTSGPDTGAVVSSDGTITAAGLTFAFPSTWQSTPPASSMRLAQAALPGGAELMVFHLGVGGGGGVDANFDRWVAQMEVAAGTTPVRDRFEAGALVVHLIDVSGTLLPSTMGTGPATPQPDSRLIGAVIEGPGGPWFFKATGPAAAVEAEKANLVAMLQAARPSAA